MERPPLQVIGPGSGIDLLFQEGPFGDVRDVIVSAPNWYGKGHGYATSDIFTVRHPLIRELAPKSVFEFGALLGYFLLTAVDAAPSLERVGWIDTEGDMPGSNGLCAENLADYAAKHDRDLTVFYQTQTRQCLEFAQADLVQVDGAHSYPDCLTDLVWAMELAPKAVFVDDYDAIEGVQRATDEFAAWHGVQVEHHETVNGLAVLRF